MSTGSAERRRVVIARGSERLDVALPTNAPLAESLAQLGIADARSTALVVGADGSTVSLDSGLPESLSEGSLMTIVDIASMPTKARPTSRVDAASASSHRLAWSFAAVLAGVAIVAGATLAAADAVAQPVSYGLAALLGVAAWLSAVTSTRQRTAHVAATALIVPPLLAFAAGFIAVPTGLEAALHLAVTCGLLSASVAAAIVHLRSAAAFSLGATGVVLLSLVIVTGLWAVTLFLGWPSIVPAAIAVGLAPIGLRVLPSICLDVPEGQLLEYDRFMSNTWTVRGRSPGGFVPIRTAQVTGMIGNAHSQLAVGTILFSALPGVFLPVVLAGSVVSTRVPDAVATVGALVLAAAVCLALLLFPRGASDPVLRWAPRIGAAVVLAELGFVAALELTPDWLLLCSLIVLALALALSAASIALSRGVRSLSLSRLADGIEFLATVLALPAALVAAGIITILRGVASA